MRPLRGRAPPAGATMSENETLSPISCESCRQRKCKCDRKLPFCSQCSNETSKCSYPESGKRGLPLGYLNQLEHRLAETESALYAALMTLRSSRPALVVEAKAKPDSAQKQKAARMEEWTQLPLQNWSDMEHWRIAMSDHFLIEQSQEAPFAESSGLEYSMPVSSQITSDTPQDDMHTKISSGIYAWQPRDVQMGSSYGTDLRPPGMVSSPVYSRGHTAVEPEAVTSPTEGSSEYADITRAIEGHSRGTAQSTMADELSKSHPSIYF